MITKLKNLVLMKSTLVFCGLIMTFCGAQAQGKWELKTDVVPYLIEFDINLSGEYILTERIGVEASVWYGSDGFSYTDTDTTTGVSSNVSLENKQMVLFVAGKYYFSPKHGGDRFFAGLTAYHQFNVVYKQINVSFKKPQNATGVGVMVGYKWMIKERLVIEADLLASYSTDDLFFLLPSLKLGYRF